MKPTTTENDGRTGLRCYLGHSGGDAPRARVRGRIASFKRTDGETRVPGQRAAAHPWLDRRAAR